MHRYRLPLKSCVFLLGLAMVVGCRTEPPPETFEPEPEVTPETEFDRDFDAPPEEEVAEVRAHRLSDEALQRYSRVAEAVQQMTVEEPEATGMEELASRLAEAETLDEIEQILGQHPGVQEALREAGITSRDYVLTGTALMGAYTYVLMREQGVPDPFRPDYVADEHIRFVEQNRADVDAVFERLQDRYGEDV